MGETPVLEVGPASREKNKLIHCFGFWERRGFRYFVNVWRKDRGYRDLFHVEAYALSGWPSLSLQICHGKWTLHIGLYILSLYLSIPGKYRDYGKDRTASVSFYGGALSWRIWCDPMGWSSETPKWRDGYLNFVDLFLGRRKCTHTLVEEREVLIPMPEKAYPATAKLENWVWKRPRWFAKRIKRVSIDIPGGLPFAGKGENFWDCGDDATYAMTTGECNSITDGVGELVKSMLRRRVKNGGWSDYNWSRPATPHTQEAGK